MAPNAYPNTTSPGTTSSGYSSDGSSFFPDYATPSRLDRSYSDWRRYQKHKNPLDYTDSVKEMDRQLDTIRKKPSKVSLIKNLLKVLIYDNFI